MIDISGLISSICAVNTECRVQDKDVRSFPVTRYRAGEGTKLIEIAAKKKATYSLDLSVGSYISSPTYSERFHVHEKGSRGFSHKRFFTKDQVTFFTRFCHEKAETPTTLPDFSSLMLQEIGQEKSLVKDDP
jgi:hypothetical protein